MYESLVKNTDEFCDSFICEIYTLIYQKRNSFY